MIWNVMVYKNGIKCIYIICSWLGAILLPGSHLAVYMANIDFNNCEVGVGEGVLISGGG